MHALTIFSLLPFSIAAVQAERSERRFALISVIGTGTLFVGITLVFSLTDDGLVKHSHRPDRACSSAAYLQWKTNEPEAPAAD
jgi:hypothetical protein